MSLHTRLLLRVYMCVAYPVEQVNGLLGLP